MKTESPTENRVQHFVQLYEKKWRDNIGGGWLPTQMVKGATSGLSGLSKADKHQAMERIINQLGLPRGAEIHILNASTAIRVLAETEIRAGKAEAKQG